MPALKQYRTFLAGTTTERHPEIELNEATRSYMEQVAGFGPEELVVLDKLNLTELHSHSFWANLAATDRTTEQRQAQLVSAYSRIMFASGQLPGLLGLVREASAVDSLHANDPDTGVIALRVHDSVEPSSDPERLARLIDGLDMIYESCAVLAQTPPRGLKLMSVSGLAYRTLVFHGHAEPVTATRRIIRSLNERVGHTGSHEVSALEQICRELPFMYSLDELSRVGALSVATEGHIRQGVVGGAIMVVEAGALLTDYQESQDRAKIDMDASAFDAIDDQAESYVEEEYMHKYRRARDHLIAEPTDGVPQDNRSINTGAGARSEGIADEGGDELDALVHDLHSRYKRK